MKRLLLGTALLSALSFTAHADTVEHLSETDEVVTVGQRIGSSNVDELTSPVSVMTAADIEARGQTYVSDLLRSLPGISVNSSGPAGSLTQIRMRGAEANHVLVLIDGVDASNANTGEFDFAGLNARDIARIEVLRGEQSALYGSDAVGGVINIITKAGATRESMSVALEAGSRSTFNGQLSAVVPIKGASLSVNGNVFTTGGYNISGPAGEADGSKSRSVNVGLNNVRLGAVTLSAKGSVSKLESEFDTGFPFPVDTNDELTTDARSGRVDARFDLGGFEHLLTLSANETAAANPNAGFRNDITGDRTTANWAAKKVWGAHTLTVLAETEKEGFTTFGGVGAGQNQTQSIRNEALAADYRFNQGAITVTGSLRQDFNDRFEDEMTWRAGGGYAFENIGGRVRASVGTGVKNPTLTELFGFFPAFFAGNPALTPEKSLGYNIGYEQTWLDDALNFSIDYFHSDLENEIFTDFGVFPATAKNRTTDSTRQGVEVQARWTLSEQFSAQGSMTFLDADENGVKEIRRPDFLGSATFTWKPLDVLSFTASVDHTGSQLDSDFSTFPSTARELDAYTLVGLNAAYDVNESITLTLRGDNLLDEKYQEVLGYASQGRGIYAGLRARFD